MSDELNSATMEEKHMSIYENLSKLFNISNGAEFASVRKNHRYFLAVKQFVVTFFEINSKNSFDALEAKKTCVG